MPDDTAGEVIRPNASLPPGGGRVWSFPHAASTGHADIIVQVRRRDGSSWIACLQQVPRLEGAAGAAFVLPCGDRVYLAGGVADRDEPDSWQSLEMREPISASWARDRSAVVLSDGLSLAAFDCRGLLWQARQVGELRVTSVTASMVICRIFDPALGDEVERRFDLQTGRTQPAGPPLTS